MMKDGSTIIRSRQIGGKLLRIGVVAVISLRSPTSIESVQHQCIEGAVRSPHLSACNSEPGENAGPCRG
jgi:hypothetical protein